MTKIKSILKLLLITVTYICVAVIGIQTVMAKDAVSFTQEQNKWIEENKGRTLKFVYWKGESAQISECAEGYLHGFIPDAMQIFTDITGINVDVVIKSDLAECVESLNEKEANANFVSFIGNVSGMAYTKSELYLDYAFYKPTTVSREFSDTQKYTVGFVDIDRDAYERLLNQFKGIYALKYSTYEHMYQALMNGEIEMVLLPNYSYITNEFKGIEPVNVLQTINVATRFFGDAEFISVLDAIMAETDVYQIFNANLLTSNLGNLKLSHDIVYSPKNDKTISFAFYESPMFHFSLGEIKAGLFTQIADKIKDDYGIQTKYIDGEYSKLFQMFMRNEIDIFPNIELLPFLGQEKNYSSEQIEISTYPKFVIQKGNIMLYGKEDQRYVGYRERIADNKKINVGVTSEFDGLLNSGRLHDSDDLIFTRYATLAEVAKAVTTGEVDYAALDVYSVGEQYEGLFEKGIFARYEFVVYTHHDDYVKHLYNALFSDAGPFSSELQNENYLLTLGTNTILYEATLQRTIAMEANKRANALFFIAFVLSIGVIAFITISIGLIMRRVEQKKTDYLRVSDHLTKISNRFAAETYMNKLMQEKKTFHVALIDVDFFKQFNDKYGHDCGDQALIKVANSLQDEFFEKGLAARIGGDEFTVITKLSLEETIRKFEKVQQAVSKFMYKEEHVKITLSIGISNYPKDSNDLAEIYLNTDKALFESKQQGRDRYSVYK